MTEKNKFLSGLALTLLLAALALAGCGGATEAPPTTQVAAQPTATVVAAQPPTLAPTEPPPPTDTPAPTDTPQPSVTPTPEIADNSSCVACHTSEETLKAVAKVEPTPESISEGEG